MQFNRSLLLALSFLILGALVPARNAGAQSVQPLIAEYVEHASGSFDVTNSSLYPSVVQLDAKSFTISPDGTGVFHPLDPSIHLELSTTSLRLEPKQTAHVFYKVSATDVPAWLCIYSSFSSLKKSPGINVRIMLPHTIYLYQKQPLQKEAIEVGNVKYDPANHRVTCELTNTSARAGRVASVEVSGPHSFTSEGGFPMLPHQTRLLSIEWTSSQIPRDLSLEFQHFSLKRPVLE